MFVAASSSTPSSPWWVTVVVTLGAVGLTIIGNYLLANRQAKTQLDIRRVELEADNVESRRQEKVTAFSAFIEAANQAWQVANDFLAKARASSLGAYRDESREATTRLTKTWLDLQVVADEPTRTAAGKLVDSLNELLQAAATGHWDDKTGTPRADFLSRIRDELYVRQAAASAK